jgi:glyoxylase-like metal-dependent hydrolase (beta-lactamase superfamily II)
MKKIHLLVLLIILGLFAEARNTVIKRISRDVITVSPDRKQLQGMGWPNNMINSVAVNTSEGIVLINTQNSPANARLIKQAVSEHYNNTKFVYVINSHGLSGHTGGNCEFMDSYIIAHENSINEIQDFDDLFLGQTVDFLRKEIFNKNNVLDTVTIQTEITDSISRAMELFREYETDLVNNYRVRFPDITFEHKYTLESGNKTFEIMYMGKGHGTADVMIYIAEEKVLCTGNLFHLGAHSEEAMPSFYIHKVNDINYWISTMTHILENWNDIDYVITTHGKKPFKRENIEFINEYCIEVQTLVKNAKLNKLDMEEIQDIETFKPLFRKYSNRISLNQRVQEMHERNIRIIWRYIE